MTKSYYYIPTHFLYSSLLFFLLIFMHQLIHCHTLLQPFSQIFLFRIYVPTTYTHPPCLTLISTRPALRPHRYTRPYSPHKPIHNDTVPQTHTPTQPQIHTHKFHTHRHANSTPIQPHKHTPTLSHKHTQTSPNRPPHTYTPANRHTTQAPTTLTLTPTQPPSAIRQARHQQAIHP